MFYNPEVIFCMDVYCIIKIDYSFILCLNLNERENRPVVLIMIFIA